MALTLIHCSEVINKAGEHAVKVLGVEQPWSVLHWEGQTTGGEPGRILVVKVRSGTFWVSLLETRRPRPAEFQVYRVLEGPVAISVGAYERRGDHYRVERVCDFPVRVQQDATPRRDR